MGGVTHKAASSMTTAHKVSEAEWAASATHQDSQGNTLAISRSATLIVAASDASAKSIAGADYTCDGVADDVQIQAAIDALPAGGGKVKLSEGVFNIVSLIDLTSSCRLEGHGKSTILKPSGDNHVIVFSAGSTRAELANLYIWDEVGNQTTTAAILLNNGVAQAIWYARIEHVEIRNTYYGIRTSLPAAAIANGVNHALVEDVFINNTRYHALRFHSFYDCTLRDIIIDLASIPASLTVANVYFVNEASESGSWIVRLKVLGRKGVISSSIGMLIDDVRSLWLQDCFLDSCGDTCYRFNNDVHRTKLTGCRAQSGAQQGFEWWTAASGTVELDHCSALSNGSRGFVSQAGDTSTKYILGGQSIGNVVGELLLPTGTNVVKDLQGYVTENNVLSPAFAIDGVAVVTVTIPHGLSITPVAEDCQLTVVEDTNVDDWAAGYVKVESVGAVNVVAKVNVTTASATGGATAKLLLRANLT